MQSETHSPQLEVYAYLLRGSSNEQIFCTQRSQMPTLTWAKLIESTNIKAGEFQSLKRDILSLEGNSWSGSPKTTKTSTALLIYQLQ